MTLNARIQNLWKKIITVILSSRAFNHWHFIFFSIESLQLLFSINQQSFANVWENKVKTINFVTKVDWSPVHTVATDMTKTYLKNIYSTIHLFQVAAARIYTYTRIYTHSKYQLYGIESVSFRLPWFLLFSTKRRMNSSHDSAGEKPYKTESHSTCIQVKQVPISPHGWCSEHCQVGSVVLYFSFFFLSAGLWFRLSLSLLHSLVGVYSCEGSTWFLLITTAFVFLVSVLLETNYWITFRLDNSVNSSKHLLSRMPGEELWPRLIGYTIKTVQILKLLVRAANIS